MMEEELNEIALAVEVAIEATPIVLPDGVHVHDRPHATGTHRMNDAVCVVGAVGDPRLASCVWQEALRHRGVVLVAGRQRDVKRPAFRVDEGVDLG